MKPKPRIKKSIPLRQGLSLPPEVVEAFERASKLDKLKGDVSRSHCAAYIYALRQKKWTLVSIANVLGLSRERVRQLEEVAIPAKAEALVTQGFPVPDLPTYEIDIPDHSYVVNPKDETLQRLLELQPLAQKVRYNHKNNREAAEEYTALLNKAVTEEGVTVFRLARLLGVTHGAIRFRLVRYGYLEPKTGKSKVYQRVKTENRSKR
jgi:hypothetical protein